MINDETGNHPCKCQNCYGLDTVSDLGCQLWDVEHLTERISPGEIAPAGQCPDAGRWLIWPTPDKLLSVSCRYDRISL
jgi:hypothetical protein